MVGHALYDEVLPFSPVSREEAAACMCRMLTVLSILPS